MVKHSYSGTRSVLLVDITSSSAASAIVLYKDNEKPFIAVETRYSYRPGTSYALTREAMLHAFRASLYSVFDAKAKGLSGIPSPEVALVTLSRPWIAGGIIKSSSSEEEVRNLYQNLRIELGLKEDSELDVFDTLVMNATKNGYKVRPEEKGAEVTHLVEASAKELTKKIETEIIKVFGVSRGVSFQSFSSVLSSVTEKVHARDGGLFVSMSGFSSDVLTKRPDGNFEVWSIPFGPMHFAGNVSKAFNVPLEVSESYLSLLGIKALHAGLRDELESALGESEKQWKRHWKEARMTGSLGNAPKVYVASEQKHGKLAKMLIESVLPEKEVILLGKDEHATHKLVASQHPHFDSIIRIIALHAFHL